MDSNSSDNVLPGGAPSAAPSQAPLGDAKSQIAGKLKDANNILVTVSRNPSVDQLAACIGLTLLLNKMNKHAAAVFSGEVPSTLEFLKPEETFEKTTDSLRDFIIALDKSKAAKLRYKVENDVVRIFITPYRTSITQDDLEFSQGDFNVDLVLGLGVQNQDDLDEVIQENGRILHDATVATINLTADGGLGSINWHDSGASSLCELATELAEELGQNLIDNQIATALLTGIVAATERFRNEKTSPRTMTTSSQLMAAGANQQLVASELDKPAENGEDFSSDEGHIDHDEPSDDKPKDSGDGSLDIDHEVDEADAEPLPSDQPPAGPNLPDLPPEPEPPAAPMITTFNTAPLDPTTPAVSGGSSLLTTPPTNGGTLTAAAAPEALDPLTDPLSIASLQQHHLLVSPPGAPAPGPTAEPVAVTPPSPAPLAPEPPAIMPPEPAPTPVVESTAASASTSMPGPNQTLTDLEASLNSPHAAAAVADARDQVAQALNPVTPPAPASDTSFDPTAMGITTEAAPPAGAPAPTSPAAAAPPPVPPPIPFQFGAPPTPPGA